MDCSMSGLSVPHHLLKFAHIHVHCINDAIQPPHPLMPSVLSALNLSQHQGIFQWVGCSHQMTRILEFQLQHQLFQWVFRIDFPSDWCLCCPRNSQESSPAPQFKGINSLALCLLYGPALTSICDLGKTIGLSIWTFVGRVMSLLFKTLSRFSMAFLPRSNCSLISWLHYYSCFTDRKSCNDI